MKSASKKRLFAIGMIALMMTSSSLRQTRASDLDEILKLKKGQTAPIEGMLMSRPVFEKLYGGYLGNEKCKDYMIRGCDTGTKSWPFILTFGVLLLYSSYELGRSSR